VGRERRGEDGVDGLAREAERAVVAMDAVAEECDLVVRYG
jgi:hypothetical protein